MTRDGFGIAMMVLAVIILIVALWLYQSGTKNVWGLPGDIIVSHDGFKYKITCVEGKQFIAYRTCWGYWCLSGTGRDCKQQEGK